MTVHWIIVFSQLLMTSPLQAQGQYPYCAQFSDGTSADCGFSSLQMCERSVTGVGGVCNLNPAGPPVQPATTTQNEMPFNSLAVPPPPFAQQSSGPLQLPDASHSQPCNPLIDGTYCSSAGGGAPIQSLSNDLAIGGGDPPATLGAITFSAGHNACIGLFGSSSCGGS
jgi:Protein of unknown function (DUF3551)